MTFFLLKGIDAVSQAIWHLSENAANNSDLLLFIGTTWGYPMAVGTYKDNMGQAIGAQEILINMLYLPGWIMGDVNRDMLGLRTEILGFVAKTQEQPKTTDDCVTDEYYEGDSPVGGGYY